MSYDIFKLETLRLSLDNILTKLIAACPAFEVHGAILDSKGDLILAAGSNPLHYTAFEGTVKSARRYISLKNAETIVTNDPYVGNTRFCDLMLIHGAFGRATANDLRYFIAVQMTFPQLLNKRLEGLARSAEEEGFRVPPTLLDAGVQINPEIIGYLAMSGINAQELTASLDLAKGALRSAATELSSLDQQFGREMGVAIEELNKYSEKMMRRSLHEIPDGEYTAHDVLENDGFDGHPLRIQCKLSAQGENVLVNFAGTSKQTKGPYNCHSSLTQGAVFWVFRGMVKAEIPINAGAFRAFSVEAPEGSLINAKYPAPLLGGYFETTKRIVDTLFLALNKALPTQIPAQNAGTSAVTLFQFQEKLFVDVLGSGAGASRENSGAAAIMAELHNTPAISIEEIENTFPLQVTHSGVRESSGGDGKHDGGNGLTRGYKLLEPATLTLLSDRRASKARGLYSGVSGLHGEFLTIPDGEKSRKHEKKEVIKLSANDIYIVNTPGGGGWGMKDKQEEDSE